MLMWNSHYRVIVEMYMIEANRSIALAVYDVVQSYDDHVMMDLLSMMMMKPRRESTKGEQCRQSAMAIMILIA